MKASDRTRIAASGTVAVAVAGALLLASMAHAEENRVSFPQDLDALVHFTTVNRGEVTEHMLTSAEAVAAVQAGDPIPEGTQVILADYHDDALYRLFVMEKGPGWGADYADSRTEDWQFQWYWPDGSVNMDENTRRCRSCHAPRGAENEFMYTFDDLKAYAP